MWENVFIIVTNFNVRKKDYLIIYCVDSIHTLLLLSILKETVIVGRAGHPRHILAATRRQCENAKGPQNCPLSLVALSLMF